MYVPVDVPAFGGLDLRDPEDATGSPDLRNIRFDSPDRSRISSRPGYTVVGSSNHYSPEGIYYSPGLNQFVVYGHGSGGGTDAFIRASSTSGTSVTVGTAYTYGVQPWSVAEIPGQGAYSTAQVYLANGSNVLVRLTTSALTTLSAACSTKTAAESSFSAYSRSGPLCYAVGVQPVDNRLVAAGCSTGPNSATGSSSHVFFSQPDNGEKWDETDYVVLGGGDGEPITAVASWNNQLFVFKKTRFYVFYGNSTDADGGTVFNYRTVDGAFPGNSRTIYPGDVCVAPDGVYVWTANGVYRTTGGMPQLVSGPIQSLFTATAPAALSSPAPPLQGSGGSFYFRDSLYFTRRDASGRWYVLTNGEWSVWTPTLDSYGATSYNGLLYSAQGTGIAYFSNSVSTDNGTAFTSYYTSPYQAWGSPGVEKTVRQTELHGTGTVSVSWGRDLQSHGYARSVTMLNGRGLDRTAVRGESLSWKVSGSAWSLNRLVPFLREQRGAGVET